MNLEHYNKKHVQKRWKYIKTPVTKNWYSNVHPYHTLTATDKFCYKHFANYNKFRALRYGID